MGNMKEMGQNIGQFAKRNAGRLILGSTLAVGGVTAGGYEVLARAGKGVQAVTESVSNFIRDDPFKQEYQAVQQAEQELRDTYPNIKKVYMPLPGSFSGGSAGSTTNYLVEGAKSSEEEEKAIEEYLAKRKQLLEERRQKRQEQAK